MILDKNRRTVQVGDRLVWSERCGGERTGVVEADAKYTDGMKIGGRSVANIRDEADWHLIVS